MGRKKRAHFGLKGGKRQWCGPCAKRHGGVYLSKQPMCEGCQDRHASYGLPNTTKRKWCASCAKDACMVVKHS